MLHRFLNDDLWKLKEVSEGLRQIPFPTDAADVANQWSVFGRVLRHESDGTVLITVVNRILAALAERGELDAFAGDIEKRLVDWSSGRSGRREKSCSRWSICGAIASRRDARPSTDCSPRWANSFSTALRTPGRSHRN